jgi:hypothetical protein
MMTHKRNGNVSGELCGWRRRLLEFALLAVCVSIASVLLFTNVAFFHDDAYITLRYCRNFLAGNGVVWNPGEYVQGYSNFLHLMLISGLGRMGVDLPLGSRLVSAAAFAVLVCALYLFPRWFPSRAGPRPLSLLPMILVSTSAPLLVWVLGGLEGVLFSTLVTLGVLTALQVSQSRHRTATCAASGTLLSLSCLTRPDGVVFVAVTLLYLFLAGRWKDAMWFAIPAVVLGVPYVVWVHSYYGDVLPNTFYVKMSHVTSSQLAGGLTYVARYAAAPPFSLLILSAVSLLAVCSRLLGNALKYIWCVVGAYLGFVVYAGGDHMPGFRLLLPVIPLVSLGIYLALRDAVAVSDSKMELAIYALITVGAASQIGWEELNPRKEDPASRVGSIVGKYIAAHWPAESLVALNTAGSTPFHAASLRFIDMLGLNDRHIARRKVTEVVLPWQLQPGHLKGDGAYVLSRKPDYIIVGPAEGTSITAPWFLSDLEMQRDARFVRDFTPHVVSLDAEGRPTNAASAAVCFTYYARTR